MASTPKPAAETMPEPVAISVTPNNSHGYAKQSFGMVFGHQHVAFLPGQAITADARMRAAMTSINAPVTWSD